MSLKMEREVLWRPSESRVKNSHMFHFMRDLEREHNIKLETYDDLHQWSIQRPGLFWTSLLDFFHISYRGAVNSSCTDLSFKSYGWFPEVQLNFAENLLKNGEDDDIAFCSVLESGEKKEISYLELREQVRLFQKSVSQYLSAGDVLGAYMPNISETAISMLGATSLGGVFTSTSCDFGVQGVLDRFSQSRPKVIVAASGYEYNGKYFDLLPRLREIESELDDLEVIVVVDFLNQGVDLSGLNKAVLWDDFLKESEANTSPLDFESRSFQDPLYIMYSSGTTGKPKCMVHSIGGTLLQHVKELGLHCDLKEEKTIFYFTTCGWMMWNWLVSSLFFGSKVVLFEGSPGFKGLDKFMDIINRESIHIFGTSPKFLRALEDRNYDVKNSKDGEFSSLETILSTGAPLLPEQFDYVYDSISEDVMLSSICGGTDILGCFMLGCPTREVYRGEIQCLGLGMDVACFNEKGESVLEQEGELVCLKSFPSRPLYFLDDPDGNRMNEAYFNTYENVWHHGDFITLTEDRSVIVFGRSDATLNPGGVRIGTSEIYRQTETFDEIEDSLCVGKINAEGDVDIFLFLKLKESITLSEELKQSIVDKIKRETTPRHIPKFIHSVDDIPYTRSGKKMEMAVARILNSKPLNNIEAVANPDSLTQFEKFSRS